MNESEWKHRRRNLRRRETRAEKELVRLRLEAQRKENKIREIRSAIHECDVNLENIKIREEKGRREIRYGAGN